VFLYVGLFGTDETKRNRTEKYMKEQGYLDGDKRELTKVQTEYIEDLMEQDLLYLKYHKA
jgi:hypothetical protein